MEAAASGGGKQIDNVLDGFVGTMVGGFEPAVGAVSSIWVMMEAAVGEGPTQPLMEEEKEQRDLDAFVGEAVGVAGAIALQQGMTLELAQSVAPLVETIGSLRESEGGQDGLVDVLGRPTADVCAAVQEHFHQLDDAGVVDLDAGVTHRADGDRQGDALR